MIEKVKEYVSWSAEDEARLEALLPLAKPAFSKAIDAFYAKILETPDMARVITEGPRQVERLKLSLERWLGGVFTRRRDADYGASIEMIGHVHVRIGLDLHFMVTMMNTLGEKLTQALVSGASPNSAGLFEDLASLHKALCLDLALMLNTYSAGRELKVVLAERRAAWERVRDQENLALVGKMAASVAHEVKNPLAALSSVVQSLLEKLPAGSSEKELGSAVLKRVDGLNRYIDELLVFTRNRPIRPVRVDPSQVVSETASMFRKDPRFQDLRVEIEGTPSPAPLLMDPDQIQRLLLNLLINAADAQGGKGRILVRLSADDSFWRMDVVDEGPGIEPSMRDQVFQPFFSTKKQGSGLGLAQARQTALAHSGSLRVSENPAGGTVFTLEIPTQFNEESSLEQSPPS